MNHGEAQEQSAVVQYCDLKRIPIFAIPNGGYRNAKEGYFLKLQGVRRGVPDLFVPVKKGQYGGCFLEMKYGKNRITTDQARWLKDLQAQGYFTAVCYSAEKAIEVIEWYLSLV